MLATLHQDRDFTCCCQRGSFISSSGRLRQAEASVFVDCQRICGAWCRGVSPESEELCQPLSSWPPSPQVSCAVKLERRICHMNLLSIACYSAESSMLPQPSTTQIWARLALMKPRLHCWVWSCGVQRGHRGSLFHFAGFGVNNISPCRSHGTV